MTTLRLLLRTITQGQAFGQVLIKLAQAELREQAGAAGKASGLAAGALILLLLALPFLLMGIVDLLVAHGLPPFAAFFVVGGVLLLLSLVLGLTARAGFRRVTLRPDRTLNQVRRLSEAVRAEPAE